MFYQKSEAESAQFHSCIFLTYATHVYYNEPKMKKKAQKSTSRHIMPHIHMILWLITHNPKKMLIRGMNAEDDSEKTGPKSIAYEAVDPQRFRETAVGKERQ